MQLTIIGAESLGVRGLCCLVTTSNRRIVIDPGVALGYTRHGLLPHPLQVAVGRMVRERIIAALGEATDVVISHFHGDHIPLAEANPYQLSLDELPPRVGTARCWSMSGAGLSADMLKRFTDLSELFGNNLTMAEGISEGPLSFSGPFPHGVTGTPLGTVMMTRIESDGQVFVHASDIQLLDDSAVDQIVEWGPAIVLAAGPPLYLDRLSAEERDCAWNNAIRLVKSVDAVVLDHHLMRSREGEEWLDAVSKAAGRRAYCAADYMGRPRRLLEAQREQLYEKMPVPADWHARYARSEVGVDGYLDDSAEQIG